MTFEDTLSGVPADQYGAEYRSHVLEVYRVYVEMADKISSRRETANSFFLTLNTAVIGLSGYLSAIPATTRIIDARVPIAIAGIAIAYLWYRIIRSYRDLNSAKFRSCTRSRHAYRYGLTMPNGTRLVGAKIRSFTYHLRISR